MSYSVNTNENYNSDCKHRLGVYKEIMDNSVVYQNCSGALYVQELMYKIDAVITC